MPLTNSSIFDELTATIEVKFHVENPLDGHRGG